MTIPSSSREDRVGRATVTSDDRGAGDAALRAARDEGDQQNPPTD